MGSVGKVNSTETNKALKRLDKAAANTSQEWRDEYFEGDTRYIQNPITTKYDDNYWETQGEIYDKLSKLPGKDFGQSYMIKNSKIQTVPVNKIEGLQNYVDQSYLRTLIEQNVGVNTKGHTGTGETILIKYKNKYWVMDGNHRVAAAKLRGKKEIKTKVFNLK